MLVLRKALSSDESIIVAEFDLSPVKGADLRKHRVSDKVLSAMKAAVIAEDETTLPSVQCQADPAKPLPTFAFSCWWDFVVAGVNDLRPKACHPLLKTAKPRKPVSNQSKKPPATPAPTPTRSVFDLL